MITFEQLTDFPLPKSLLDADASEQDKVLNSAVARLHPYGIGIEDKLQSFQLAALADLVGKMWLRPDVSVDLSPFSTRTLGVDRRNYPKPIPLGDGTGAQSASQSASGPGVDATARAEAQAAQRAAQDALDRANAVGLVAASNAGKLMPPNNAEADAGAANTIRGWTASLIKRVVEGAVPAWAREANPPTAEGGISEARATTIANNAANAAVENGVQIPARAAPGNTINGKQQYFAADWHAPDAEVGQSLLAHQNGSTYWGDAAFPAVAQVSPSHADKANPPSYFRVTVHSKPNAFPLATKLRLTLLGRTVTIAYAPGAIIHTVNFQVTAAMRTALAALGTDGVASETQLTVTPLDASDRVSGPGVVPGYDLQVIESAARTADLTALQQIGLLNIEPNNAAIAYATGGLEAALTPAIKVRIANPEVVTDDVWVEGLIEGQPALVRRKWTNLTNSLDLTLQAGNRDAVVTALLADGEQPSVVLDLHFYDAANAGNIIEIRKVHIALAERQLPKPTVANKGKIPAIKADGTVYELIEAPSGGVSALPEIYVAAGADLSGGSSGFSALNLNAITLAKFKGKVVLARPSSSATKLTLTFTGGTDFGENGDKFYVMNDALAARKFQRVAFNIAFPNSGKASFRGFNLTAGSSDPSQETDWPIKSFLTVQKIGDEWRILEGIF